MRKVSSLVFLCLAVVMLWVAVAPAKEIVIATPEEIEGVDIQQIEWENVVHALLFYPPINYSKDMSQVLPGSASEWGLSEDGKTMHMTFANAGKFPNGKPLTAEAVKASMDRYLEISPYAADLAGLKSIEVKGDTLYIYWENPPIPSIVSIASSYGGIVDAAAVNEMGKEKANREVLSYGQMQVDEWVQGSHISLKPNPDFKCFFPEAKNKGAIKVDKVTVRFIPDDFTRVTEIQAGDVDVIWNVPVENLAELEANKDIKLYRYLQPGSIYYYVNPEAPNLGDSKVRKALQLAINRDEIITFLDNTAEARYGVFSSSVSGYSQAVEDELKKEYGYNLEEAAKLLDEAGWKDSDNDGIRDKDGKPLSFVLMSALDEPSLKKIGPVVQAQYKRLGVDMQIREYESKYIKDATREKNYDIASRRYVWPDADILMYLYHTESGITSYEDIDAAINKARFVIDSKKRAELFGEAQKLIMDKGICIPVMSNYYYVAARANITGFDLNASGTPMLTDLDKE